MIRAIFSILFACLLVVGYSIAQQVSVTPFTLGIFGQDSNGNITATSFTSLFPLITFTNTANDANGAGITFQKNRNNGGNIVPLGPPAGCNTPSGDTEFNITGSGQISGVQRILQQIVGFYKSPAVGTSNSGSVAITLSDENGTCNNTFLVVGSGMHIGSSTAAAHRPTVTGCGISPGSPLGGDVWGQVLDGFNSNGCTINFGAAWSAVPVCIPYIIAPSATTTQIAISATPTTTGGANGFGGFSVQHAQLSQVTIGWNCHEST